MNAGDSKDIFDLPSIPSQLAQTRNVHATFGGGMNAHLYHSRMARVLDRMGGLYLLSDILSAIDCGRMQGHVEGNSWVVTQINNFPRAKVLDVVAYVGDLKDGEALHARMLSFADRHNAGVLRATGRMGWIPNALAYGWRLKAKNFVYMKEC